MENALEKAKQGNLPFPQFLKKSSETAQDAPYVQAPLRGEVDIVYSWESLKGFSEKQIRKIEGLGLPKKAIDLYRQLLKYAILEADAKNYSKKVTQMTCFFPLCALCEVMGYGWRSETTIAKYCAKLKALGLLDYRQHFGSYKGATRVDGMVWAIKVNPSAVSPAKLSYADLKHQYRDLEAAIAAGNTAWAWKMERLRGQRKGLKTNREVQELKTFSLNPVKPSKSFGNMTPQKAKKPALDVLFGLIDTAKNLRNEKVSELAGLLCKRFGDASINMYRKFLWNCMRLQVLDRDVWATFHRCLSSVWQELDSEDSIIKNAGAVFVTELKKAGVYDHIHNVEQIRIGFKPS